MRGTLSVIPGVGERMRGARLATAVRLKRTVSQGLMAQLVTEELARLGSDKTVSQSNWSGYEAEKYEASAIVYRATANISGVPESFIAFGEPDEESAPLVRRVAEEPSQVYGSDALKQAMTAGAKAPRGAQIEPKDVPAADPRKKPETEKGKGKGKRAG